MGLIKCTTPRKKKKKKKVGEAAIVYIARLGLLLAYRLCKQLVLLHELCGEREKRKKCMIIDWILFRTWCTVACLIYSNSPTIFSITLLTCSFGHKRYKS